MAETKNQRVEVNERQLIQMAQQEEDELMRRQEIIQKTSNLLREAVIAKEILKEMQKAEGKVQIGIGATILVELEAKNVKKCKRAFSEGAYVEEKIEDTLKWLDEKEENLKKQYEKMQTEYTQAQARLTDILGILKQIEAEKRKLAEQAKKTPTISK